MNQFSHFIFIFQVKINDVPDDESFGKIPTAFHESYQIQRVIPRENAYENGEIWEAISKPDIQRLDAEVKHFPNDQHIAFVTRELEPTYNQNNAGLRHAKQQLKTYYMQSLDSKESHSLLNHNSPQNNMMHHHQHNQQTAHYRYPDADDDDEYFFNSRESYYNGNNNHHQQQYNSYNPLHTVQQPAAITTNTKYNNPNLRWKRSINNNNDDKNSNKIDKESSEISKNTIPSRKRRNAVLKSISWALSNEVNVIPKEMNNHDEVYRRILPYRIIPKNYHISMRPQNYDDIQKWRSTNNDNLYNVENLENFNERISNTEKRHIDNAKTEQNTVVVSYSNGNNDGNSGDVEKPPKFMRMFSEKVSNFMDMINHHVSGWWNTWA